LSREVKARNRRSSTNYRERKARAAADFRGIEIALAVANFSVFVVGKLAAFSAFVEQAAFGVANPAINARPTILVVAHGVEAEIVWLAVA